MRDIGISSSCFYPRETERAFRLLAERGIKTAEIFINARSELQPDFLAELNAIRAHYGVRVAALHPYTSFAENFMLFSAYERRYRDFLEDLKLHFAAAASLGASYYVVHGIRLPGAIEDERYVERFASMIELGRAFGVLPAQENVVRHRSQSPEFLLKMRTCLGADFRAVLDTKQARRAGFAAMDFVNALGASICHVHISDFTEENDCVIPLRGRLDFSGLFSALESCGYAGAYIIELYSSGFRDFGELEDAVRALQSL